MPKVNVHDVASSLVGTGPETTVWLDRRTGECIWMSDGYEDPELDADLDLDADHWVELPDSSDRNEWRMMERFAASQEEPGHQERLLRAIHGRGAFRMFKDTAYELGLLEPWYAYLHDETVRLLRVFLEGEGIEYEDAERPGPGAARTGGNAAGS
jgi:hypothetical protein